MAYFMDFIDLNTVIDQLPSIHAHTDEVKKVETLEEHLELTKEFLMQLFDEKGIGEIVDRLVNSLSCCGGALTEDLRALVLKMFINAVYLHDTGKINPAFQKIKMKNSLFKDAEVNDSDHSLISALIFIDVFQLQVLNIIDKNLKFYMINILYSFAYQISRHHSYLKDTWEFADKLQQKQREHFYKNYKSSTLMNIRLGEQSLFHRRADGYKRWQMDGLEFYILNRLLYALIVGCDFYATYSYKTSNNVEFGLIENIDYVISKYKEYSVYKGICEYLNDASYFSDAPINALRSELFLEAERTLLSNINRNIFYLEAPTGGGKTNIATNLALRIVENEPKFNKIFYIFPFNTLVEQTKDTLFKIFGDSLEIAVINSITPIVTKEEIKAEKDEQSINYEKSYLDRQFLHYPMILTTHVNFFNYLFGTGREVCFPLIHLCNSVIILDEIQSYRNTIWTELIMFLNRYASILNMKVIIMSATLPKLHQLIQDKNYNACIVNLIKDRNKYFLNPLFKERVHLDFEMLYEEMSLEKLSDRLAEALKRRGKPSKVLIEFIKKDTARDFYNLIKDKYTKDQCSFVIELSGDDNKYFREQAILRIKETDQIIVVATQVIEAGVDIDMDIGFKDISILDSEEQFLGRINRSCLKSDSIAYFFYMDKTEQIYRNDFRTGRDLREQEFQDILQSKDFDRFYSGCIERIVNFKSENSKNNINEFIDKAMKLDFKCVNEHMRLIKKRNFQLYIPYKLEMEDAILDGQELWIEYKKLCLDNHGISYSKKQIDLSILREKMAYFTYTIISYDDKVEAPPFYKEEFGGYFLIGEGTKYITKDGKFDRRKYLESCRGLFL